MQPLIATLFGDDYRVEAQPRHLLERMLRYRDMLTVTVGDDPTQHKSLLLHYDASAEHLTIDELRPPAALDLGTELRCMGRAAGAFVGLRCQFLRRMRWEGRDALRLSWPSDLYQLQRRRNYRVSVRTADIKRLEVHIQGVGTTPCECMDLSPTGMRVRCNVPAHVQLDHGAWIERLRFTLDGRDFVCAAQVRFSKRTPIGPGQPDSYVMGLQFHHLPPALEQALQRYVQQRDAELMRDTRF